MYEDFYGLISKPFQLNPDPGFYFSSKQHRRARAYLEYGVMRCEGFIVITGEVGAGKTTVVRGLLEGLNSENIVAASLVSTQVDAEDTLKLVAAAFGIKAKGESKGDLLISLEAFFLSKALQGKRCLLIVDEAQNLQTKAIEELRMLSNFQSGKKALLQTFLIGQPEFRKILQSPEMLQLRQRVTATCHLGPLDQDETQEYIRHRLRCAGAKEKPELAVEIFETIYSYTDGIPRRINNLMDRVLLNGFLAEKIFIDLSLVDKIIEELNSEIKIKDLENDNSEKAYNGKNIKFSKDIDITEWSSRVKNEISSRITENHSKKNIRQINEKVMHIETILLRQEKIILEILKKLENIYPAKKLK